MASARRSQAGLLGRPIARATRWTPFLVAVPLAALAMVAGRNADRPPPFENLPVAAILLAVCVGFVLDDGSETTTDSAPTSLLFVRSVRIAMVLPVALACWTAAAVSADVGWVAVSLSAGFVAMCCVAFGLAAVAIPLVGRGRSGLFAAVGLIAIFVVWPVAFDVSLHLEPTSSTWGHLYGRWLLVGGLGLATMALASTSPVTRGALVPRRASPGRPARAGVGTR